MTFQKIKETVVDEQKRITKKQLVKLVVNLGLAFIGLILSIGLAVYKVLGLQYLLLVIFGAMFGFNTVLTMYVESEDSATNIQRFAKFWWIYYILFVAIFFVLKLFRFL